jgi:hypothetical protein
MTARFIVALSFAACNGTAPVRLPQRVESRVFGNAA